MVSIVYFNSILQEKLTKVKQILQEEYNNILEQHRKQYLRIKY